MSDTPRKPILCLDFDGVVHSYTSGWHGADKIPDKPVPGAFDFIRAALLHFDVAIFSTRSIAPGGIDAMELWFELHGADFVDQLRWPQSKPPAFVTIDDRALTFTGTWPSIDELKAFEPWTKRMVPA
jgi:hypothetical protein